MQGLRLRTACILATSLTCLAGLPAVAQDASGSASGKILNGKDAFGDFRTDAPGVRRHIKPGDLPAPFATQSPRNRVELAKKPADAQLKTLPGFTVKTFAEGLEKPRAMRTAPNGDIFVAESTSGRITVLRPSADMSKVDSKQVFATGLNRPYGIAFYPPTGEPQWVYVGNTDSLVRFPYRNGDMKARGQAEMLTKLPIPSNELGHWTRDIVFAKDGSRLFVAIGSGTNYGDDVPKRSGAALDEWNRNNPLGAAWGPERNRADVLSFDPQGKNEKIYATGLRNCSGITINPVNGDLWCATNERDLLGDNIPPDYVTRVKQGAFYGWPWYYTGDHEEPRLKGARPDLKGHVTVPDVLIQAHSAALGLSFYEGDQFPADFKGNIFVALHGSWNRQKRTGYKIIRVIVKDGVPTGEYEDFVTGFGINDAHVWGRPVGVTVARDGSLLFSEDGNGRIFRVSRTARASSR